MCVLVSAHTHAQRDGRKLDSFPLLGQRWWWLRLGFWPWGWQEGKRMEEEVLWGTIRGTCKQIVGWQKGVLNRDVPDFGFQWNANIFSSVFYLSKSIWLLVTHLASLSTSRFNVYVHVFDLVMKESNWIREVQEWGRSLVVLLRAAACNAGIPCQFKLSSSSCSSDPAFC